LQIEEFKKFAAEPDAYQNICSKIAPSIFGHDDVKKAVACLLFGGSRKVHHCLSIHFLLGNNKSLHTAADYKSNLFSNSICLMESG